MSKKETNVKEEKILKKEQIKTIKQVCKEFDLKNGGKLAVCENENGESTFFGSDLPTQTELNARNAKGISIATRSWIWTAIAIGIGIIVILGGWYIIQMLQGIDLSELLGGLIPSP